MLRKLGFFSGLWWIALREREPWLAEWIERPSARIELFLYRTAGFVAVAGVFALVMYWAGGSSTLYTLFLLASAFGAATMWWRSATWVGEYREVFAGRHDR